MTINKNTTTNNQNVQDINDKINDLLAKAKKVNEDIDATHKGSRKAMDDIEARVDKSVNNLEQIYSDLDTIEKESGDELDELILKEAEHLAGEE